MAFETIRLHVTSPQPSLLFGAKTLVSKHGKSPIASESISASSIVFPGRITVSRHRLQVPQRRNQKNSFKFSRLELVPVILDTLLKALIDQLLDRRFPSLSLVFSCCYFYFPKPSYLFTRIKDKAWCHNSC